MDRLSAHDEALELVRCNLCGADEYQVRFPSTRQLSVNGYQQWQAYCCTHPGYGVHPPIVECRKCGLVYSNPRPRRAAIRHNYEVVEDPLYLRERVAREITFRRHLHSLERFAGPGNGRRLLDVGAYIGVFVEAANDAGWRAVGLEPSIWAVNYARERGLDMVRGTLEEVQFPAETFDVLTMWDVVEHLGDPLAEMRRAFELLKPGGWMAIHTMDIDSLFAKMMGPRWPWLMEMHIYFFTRRTLTAMLETAGFRVAAVRPEGRFLRLQYLTTRLRPYSGRLAEMIDVVARMSRLDGAALPVNFGDLVTAYAQKPAQ